jgi:hypothetical protein
MGSFDTMKAAGCEGEEGTVGVVERERPPKERRKDLILDCGNLAVFLGVLKFKSRLILYRAGVKIHKTMRRGAFMILGLFSMAGTSESFVL